MKVEVVGGVGEIDANEWNALTGEDDPFVEHAFLRALEESESVGADAGWLPAHITVREGDALVAALPLYVKSHSYGEYIFDWSWANAAHRMGVRYYPKLTSMSPFTPATGRRILVRDGDLRSDAVGALLAGAKALADKIKASSVHLLFLTADERAAACRSDWLKPRLSYQFHWHNQGYRSFDDYLAHYRAKLRKEVRRERRRVEEHGLEIRVLEGPALGNAEWSALDHFYRDTCYRRGSTPYLTEGFLPEIRRTFAHRVVAALAYRKGEPVAGTLNFERGAHLYGRYWGAYDDYDGLHFELCYYRLIERCIERGLSRFEAGAQGLHKLRRGLMPTEIHSAHWIRNDRMSEAVCDFLEREAAHVRSEIAALADHGPFRRSGED